MAILPHFSHFPRGNKGVTTVRKPTGPVGIFSSESLAHKATSLVGSLALAFALSPSLDDSFTVRPNLLSSPRLLIPSTDLHDPRASRRIDRPKHSTPAA